MWKLTDSEWKVLEALWAGGPQHLGQILAPWRRETGWSRTTVHTYLTRMAAKGLVSMGPVLSPAVRRYPQPGDVRRPGAAGSGGPGL